MSVLKNSQRSTLKSWKIPLLTHVCAFTIVASNSNIWTGIFHSCFTYFIMTKTTKYLGKYFVNPPHDKSLPCDFDNNGKWKYSH